MVSARVWQGREGINRMVDVAPSQVINGDELRALLAHESQPVISIFQPTVRAVVEPEENSLHLKDLLPAALKALQDTGMRAPAARELLAPMHALLEDRDFWRHQLEGLGLFRTPDLFRHYRLPVTVRELVFVGAEPHVKPLVATLFPTTRFFILALSQNSVRLLDCSRYAVHEVDLSQLDFPRNLTEALTYDDLQKPELQHHPTTGPGRAREGKAAVGGAKRGRRHAFHGHGESGEDHKDQLRRYFDAVDDGLWPVLRGETAPLILAAVDYLHPIYRAITRYQHVAEKGLMGNPDRARNEELHKEALELIEADNRAGLERLNDRFATSAARGLASADLGHVLKAAGEGRVEVAMVRGDVERWGTFSPTEGSVEPSEEQTPGTVDLLDLACRTTILHRGEAYVLDPEEVPGPDAAAIFRY
ncbi:MAG: hypothetical protein ACRDI1_11305 [Actinomycetota bacterium]